MPATSVAPSLGDAFLAHLDLCMEQMRQERIELPYVEAGPETFGVITAWALAPVPLGEAEYTRRLIEAEQIALKFQAVTVIRCHDVPEGMLWPPRTISVVASERRLNSDTKHGA